MWPRLQRNNKFGSMEALDTSDDLKVKIKEKNDDIDTVLQSYQMTFNLEAPKAIWLVLKQRFRP